MKTKFKLTFKKIRVALYVILLISNIAALFLIANFVNKYVFHAITIDRSSLVSEKNILTGDVDMEKFDKVYSSLLDKKNKNNIESLPDVFK